MVGDDTAVDHAADDIGAVHLLHRHLDQAVVDQHAHTDFQIFIEPVVGHAHLVFRALHLICCQGKKLPFFQRHAPVLEIFDPYFRSFGVQQDRYRLPHLFAQLLYHIHSFLMFVVGCVGKVTPRYIHAFQHHLSQYFLIVRCRTQGTYDLCFSHIILLY